MMVPDRWLLVRHLHPSSIFTLQLDEEHLRSLNMRMKCLIVVPLADVGRDGAASTRRSRAFEMVADCPRGRRTVTPTEDRQDPLVEHLGHVVQPLGSPGDARSLRSSSATVMPLRTRPRRMQAPVRGTAGHQGARLGGIALHSSRWRICRNWYAGARPLIDAERRPVVEPCPVQLVVRVSEPWSWSPKSLDRYQRDAFRSIARTEPPTVPSPRLRTQELDPLLQRLQPRLHLSPAGPARTGVGPLDQDLNAMQEQDHHPASAPTSLRRGTFMTPSNSTAPDIAAPPPCGAPRPRWSVPIGSEDIDPEPGEALFTLQRLAEGQERARFEGEMRVDDGTARQGQAGLAESAVLRPAERTSGHSPRRGLLGRSSPQDLSLTRLYPYEVGHRPGS